MSLKEPWSATALDLVQKRYLPRETPISVEKWLWRVASRIASASYSGTQLTNWRKRYFKLLASRTFLPTSAALHNSLRGDGSLAGCMVHPMSDNIRELVDHTLSSVLKVQLAGIGVGVDLSVISPRLADDPDTGRALPGPIEVLELITTAAGRLISYTGLKPAAFMATLFCNHPDIFSFITLKTASRLTNVNLSVTIDAAFREAVDRDGLIPLVWSSGGQVQDLTPYEIFRMTHRAEQRSVNTPDLRIGQEGKLYSNAARRTVGRVVGERLFVFARTILDVIAEAAHKCGDPGLIDLGEINLANPTHPRWNRKQEIRAGVGVIQTTTPCGEQPLLPYEVCHLGSFNLSKFVREGAFDFERLRRTVPFAVRFMDSIIDAGDNGSAESNAAAEETRKVGIGIMGLADVLADAEFAYDSPEARNLAARIMATIHQTAVGESRRLAAERGPFPRWPDSVFARRGEPPRRHATLTTIAPTGHISTLADCSTGVEPYFSLRYVHHAAGRHFVTCPALDRKLASIDYSLDQWIAATRDEDPAYRFDGTLFALLDAPTGDTGRDARLRKIKAVFRTALEIDPADHLQMVAALQEHVENGISKTINVDSAANVAEMREIFQQAMKMRLRGITVFRDGCLGEQALVRIEACPNCGDDKYLRPNDCGSLKCDPHLGGCGHDVCQI